MAVNRTHRLALGVFFLHTHFHLTFVLLAMTNAQLNEAIDLISIAKSNHYDYYSLVDCFHLLSAMTDDEFEMRGIDITDQTPVF